MNQAQGSQHYLYLYDLPKGDTTSTKLANVLHQRAGIILQRMPQIKRDFNRPFYTAIMTIPDEAQFQQACKAMRYFELAPGKPSRALPFDNDLLGSNPQKIVDHNIFVRKIPKEMTPQQLEGHFSKYGDIKSLKISLGPDHESRGYGFVCFQDPSSASRALDAEGEADSIQVIKYSPKDKRDFRKIFNNIYAKNFPPNFSEDDVRALFGKYGRIESMKFMTNDKGSFAFICYNSEDKMDREYGPRCAQDAVNNLNGASEVNGIALDDNKKLYVKEALKKTERDAERLRETIKYKSSKKRCNLYVKGFPENWSEENLRQLFSPYGEIESLKMHPPNEEKKLYAFVCFKKPDEASSAKEHITVNDKNLTINHYEIKEIRKLQIEAACDKNDFQQFRQIHSRGTGWTDLVNQEELQYWIKMILTSMPQIMKPQRQQVGGPVQRNFQQNRPQQNYVRQNRQGGHPQGGHRHPAAGNPGQIQPNMNPAMVQQEMMQQQIPADQLPPHQAFIRKNQEIINAIVPENRNYKEAVGNNLYDFILAQVGTQKAPKVTGMLIDLNIDEIRKILVNWDLFVTRVQQASDLLDRQNQQ